MEEFKLTNPTLKDLIPKSKVTLKKKFRMHAGYLEGHTCGLCKHHYVIQGYRRKYHKCDLFDTHSSATDIRLKDVACKYFEEGKNG